MCDVLAIWGAPEAKRRLFAEVMDGGRIGNALAERGGHHAQDLKTRPHGWPGRAGRPAWGGGPRLSGKKYYTTGSLTARWTGVSALDDDGALVLAFVRRGAPGVDLDTDWNVMGQRATVSGSATFGDAPGATPAPVPATTPCRGNITTLESSCAMTSSLLTTGSCRR